jgi:hypothetical protein
MLVSPKLAGEILVELTHGGPLPVHFGELLPHSGQFVRHGYVIVGDVAVRAYKAKGRWSYDDRELRRAGEALAAVDVDRQDLSEVDFPNFGEVRELPEAERAAFWGRLTWRRSVSAWMSNAARQVRHKHRSAVDPYADADWISRYAVDNNGLPGGLSMEDFTAACRDRTIGCTRLAELLVRVDGRWLLPRAYVDLLDRWQALDNGLADQARQCSQCPRKRPEHSWPHWRTPTTAGYVTLCPDCSRAAYPAYTGHLRGTLYASLRPSVRADAYLCRLCQASRASVWDHCHDHGHVRGPLCASCNTFEGKGDRFLEREGATLHLLECLGCRQRHTLPERFHLSIVFQHLAATERHGRCQRTPWVRGHHLAHGVHRFSLSCSHAGHKAWTKELSTADVLTLIRAYVDQALAEDGTATRLYGA